MPRRRARALLKVTLAATATAVAASSVPAELAGAQSLSVRVDGLDRGARPAFRSTTAVGTFVPGQPVRVEFVRDGAVVAARQVGVQADGTFRARSPRLTAPGRYRVRAIAGPVVATSRPFRLRFPDLGRGDRGRAVEALHRALRRMHFRAPKGARYTAATARAVLAYRKVNWMAWTGRASSDVLSRVLRGRGAFKLRHPRSGRHVEVDLARQVMALADGREVRHVFHISSGAPGTPSDRGHFRVYRRQPGYNRLGMLDSVYYNRGEAIHGYRSVPTYPASHGCVRSALADARFIYGWVRLGMSIHVY